MKLLITSNSFASCDTEPYERLVAGGFEITRNPYRRPLTESELIALLNDKEALLLSVELLSRRVIEQCPKLMVVSRYGVGTDNVDVDALEEKGILLEVTREANSDSVADHTIGLMIDVAHKICYEACHYRQGVFLKTRGQDLYQSTVGIIGLGAIGRRVARRLKGFDCRILVHDHHYDGDVIEAEALEMASLDEIFTTSDFVSLHLPSTPLTRGLVDRERLASMKKNALLINTARGDLVDKTALLEALENKQIGGYGADVGFQEPMTDDEFRSFNNVVITPHSAALTVGSINRMSALAADNLLKHHAHILNMKGET